MFNNPQMYTETNILQKTDASEVLNQFMKCFTWQDKECVLDIGSGCGKITSEILLPMLPASIECLIGGDVSNEMVLHAQKEYKNPKLSFVFFDLENNDEDKLKATFSAKGVNHSFDKIFSFHCLHWLKNVRKGIENMYYLTKPGGQCLVVITECGLHFDVWKVLSSIERWQPYLKNEEDLEERFPMPFSKNGKDEYMFILKENGFEINKCISIPREIPFHLYSIQFRHSMESVDPFVQYIPKDLHGSYMDDVMQTFTTMSLKKFGKTVFFYNVVVFFLSKPTKLNGVK